MYDLDNVRFTVEGYPYGKNCCLLDEYEAQGFILSPTEKAEILHNSQ